LATRDAYAHEICATLAHTNSTTLFMIIAYRTLAALLLGLFCFNPLSAQNILISYTKTDSLFVCNTDTFTVNVQNNQVATLAGATLITTLPSGLTYLPGSVTGASEFNIGNLATPSFTLPDVPGNQSLTVKIILSADCAAADVLDAGQLFIANISVLSALGNAQLSTTSIPVETGAIVVESITGQLLMGEKGDTLLRTICVKNTRLGKIGSLQFEDEHLEGYDAWVVGASGQTMSGLNNSAVFDGSFFETVGNGDAWLDQNETVCITERIIITSCGIPPFTNESILRVGWGCGGQTCRYDSIAAFIEIKPSTKIPDLVFEQIWSPPTDYCGNTPAVMGYKIKNIGKAEAKDIIFNLSLVEGLSEAGIAPNSFRIVDATGSHPITANVTSPTVLPACGLNVVFEGSFFFPTVAAKDSIEFLFDVVTCTELCEQVQPGFRADYFYKKDCPVNGFVSGFALIVPEDGYVVRGDLEASIGACLDSGNSYPFSYNAVSQYLREDGFWHLELELPLGITLDSTCGLLLDSHSPVLYETTPLANGSQNIHLAWATPLNADSAAMNFCLRYVCDTNIVCLGGPGSQNGGIIYTSECCFIEMADATYWSPFLNPTQACAINDCDKRLLAVNLSCDPLQPSNPGDSTLFDPIIPIPGLKDWWNAYRLNLGFQDNDDNRQADMPLSTATGTARLDRFLAGDTLRVEYCAVVDSATTVDTITRAIWHEIVSGDMGANDNDIFQTFAGQNEFTDSTKVRLINTRVRVRYANGSEASCDWPAQVYIDDKNYFQVVDPNSFPLEPIDDIVSEKFYSLYSLPEMFAEGCLPKPFLELGDSIFIFNDFKLDLNFKPSSSNTPDPPLVGFRTASSRGGNIFAWNQQPRKYFQYSGWRKTFTANTHSIKPCEPSVEVKKFRYSMRIARENLFPMEVRPLAWISDYRQTLPDGLELNTAKLEYLTLQDSVPFLSNLPLPFVQTPGFLDLDFAPAFAQPVDEGFTLRTNLSFKPECMFSTPDTSKQFIETSFVGCLNGDEMTILDSIKNSIGFFSNTPKLALLSPDSIVYEPSKTFEIEFSLSNLLVSPAPAAWVAVVSPSGMATDFELFNMPQNQAVAGTNGLFNLGNLNSFNARNFRLTGENIACETDSLLLIFGWGCTPISSLADSDCGRDTFVVELNLERPELELDILQEPANITLCDTSDYFEFEIYNAKIGYAYDLQASVKLPPGLQIVPGTCQISYPDGGPWVNISDPNLLSNNLFLWQINAVLPALATAGLPGFNLFPANSFRIRFKTLAECGFVANTPIIYGTTGVEPCGRQANVLNKPGEAIHIDGLDPSYGVQISIQPLGTPGVACGAAQEFAVNLNILGTPSAGDSVYISLPQGVSLFVNSYNPGLNAPAGPPTITPQGFQLPLPILQGGGTVQFTFKVQFGATAGCNDQIVLAQTRVRTEAFCQSLGAPCAVYIATGEASWSINPEHPQLAISDANLAITNGQIFGSVTVNNIGLVGANGASAQIWRDLDGNGEPSANDLLLGTLQSSVPIGPGASIVLTGLLPGLDSTQLCDLLIVLPSEANCICSDQVLPIDNLTLTHTPLIFCALSPVDLGVPAQAGFTYTWSPSNGITCTSCPSTTYTPDPNLPPNTVHTLMLTEASSGCTVIHSFDIVFGTVAQIESNNASVCKGDPTTLSASPMGTGYNWQGPGIQDPGLVTQTLTPNTSSQYHVTITFSNGCTAVDSIEIQVFQADTVQLAGLSTCADEPIEVLGEITNTPGTYQLNLNNVFGCDSLVLQSLVVWPNPITEEQRVFCFGDSLLVFDSLFTGSGQFTQVLSSIHGCDSTHVVNVIEKQAPVLVPVDTIFGTFGQIITLNGPSGFVTYVWEPSPTPPCVNCPSVTYTPDSVGYYEYLLTVAGIDGCPGELLFRVVMAPPCSADSLRIPNAFTPNGDGANDVFRVVAHEGSEVISSLEIYDRWGEKVYENQGNAYWDGTIDGQPAPSDVYVYIVKVTCGELVGKRVGDVTLLR
jgi:gliding motility-associated-like protein/uncharacterized repeat protein (TIGR01451 family)